MSVTARRYRKRGLLEFLQRVNEATAILFGRWSLHRSWQEGVTEGSRMEYERIRNGGDSLHLMDHWRHLREARQAEFAARQASGVHHEPAGAGQQPTGAAR